jgi:hypothetical protein
VAQLYPEHWVPFFVTFYDSQGYGGGILSRLQTGLSIMRRPGLGPIKSPVLRITPRLRMRGAMPPLPPCFTVKGQHYFASIKD